MALTKCTECNGLLSTTATMCPHCGATSKMQTYIPDKSESAPESPQLLQRSNRLSEINAKMADMERIYPYCVGKKGLKPMAFFLITMAIFVVLGFIGSYLAESSSQRNAERYKDDPKRMEAIKRFEEKSPMGLIIWGFALGGGILSGLIGAGINASMNARRDEYQKLLQEKTAILGQKDIVGTGVETTIAEDETNRQWLGLIGAIIGLIAFVLLIVFLIRACRDEVGKTGDNLKKSMDMLQKEPERRFNKALDKTKKKLQEGFRYNSGNSRFQRKRCYECSGTGSIRCRQCSGKGEVEGFRYHCDCGEYYYAVSGCPLCGGKGTKGCPKCRRGRISPFVKGSGKEKCKVCNGSGKMRK